MDRFIRSVLLQSRSTGRKTLSPTTLFVLLVALMLASLTGGVYAQGDAPQFDFKLIRSEIVAGSTTIAAGQEVTFTVILRNDASSADSIDVAVQYPAELAYVSGSGGTHSAANRAVSWENIAVDGGGEARRTFKLRTAGTVSSQKSVQIYAAIGGQTEHIIRATSITLVPGGTEPPPPAQPNLTGSSKRVDKAEVGPGGQLRYVITLSNSGADASVDVTDPLPAELTYVAGSVTGGGSYDSAQRRVRWDNVAVANDSTVELSFKVTAPASIDAAKNVVNTATIQASGASLTRSATVRLVPSPDNPPPPDSGAPRLEASFKLASRLIARPDDTIEYRIVLYNNGTADGVVAVRDPLPNTLAYVAGSASNEAAFNEDTNTLSWQNITVNVGRQVTLTYSARPAGTVATARTATNTAEISVDGKTIKRSIAVVLLPAEAPPSDDVIPPTVKSVTIGESDVLLSPNTTIHVEATDNLAVDQVFVREWQLITGRGLPHWRVVRSSGWIDFQTAIPWALGGDPGTHYVGVWARDAAGNVSTMGTQAIDFASLIVPNASVGSKNAAIYQVYYPAGVSVRATVSPNSGDADLYVWYPGNMLLPNGASTIDGGADDSIAFTTPRAGIYLFAVVGHTGASYDLTITAPGGPRVSTELREATTDAEAMAGAEPAAVAARVTPGLAALVGEAGLDPLGSLSATATEVSALYMPVVAQP